jgi:hypothetical protein
MDNRGGLMIRQCWWIGCLALTLLLFAGCTSETETRTSFKIDPAKRVPKKVDTAIDPP